MTINKNNIFKGHHGLGPLVWAALLIQADREEEEEEECVFVGIQSVRRSGVPAAD